MSMSPVDQARAALASSTFTEPGFVRMLKRLARTRQWAGVSIIDDAENPIRLIAARGNQAVAVVTKPSTRLTVEQADAAWVYARAGVHVLFLDPSDPDFAGSFF